MGLNNPPRLNATYPSVTARTKSPPSRLTPCHPPCRRPPLLSAPQTFPRTAWNNPCFKGRLLGVRCVLMLRRVFMLRRATAQYVRPARGCQCQMLFGFAEFFTFRLFCRRCLPRVSFFSTSIKHPQDPKVILITLAFTLWIPLRTAEPQI